ncbi:MAG: metallophosphoesterase [Wenzhouxiangella sp.]
MNRTTSFTLLQLSDCHLSADPSATYRGENADHNLKRLLPACRAFAPDGVVLSGDLAEDASAEAYHRLAKLLDGLAERFAWLPGNHDDRRVMHSVYDELGWHAGPVLEWGGWQLALIDSTEPDRPDGEVDAERLAPLTGLAADKPALAFIHHQPLSVNAPWIDKYRLCNPELFWQAVDPAIVRGVGFGHVHQAFVGEHNGVRCLSAPSTVANSQAETEKFTADPTGPKARWYRLRNDGRWQTGLISVGMN